MSVNRRRFCQQVVYAGFGGYLALATGACRRRRASELAPAAEEEAGFCTPVEFQTLEAACERLFPKDEDPGAIELNAPHFVDRQLLSDAFSGWQKLFRKGLADLENDALMRYHRSFFQLAAAEQDALLASWIRGAKERQLFVHRLMHLTLEGVFCDPSHGGNRGGRAWTLLGFQPSSPRSGEHHHIRKPG
jgi:gluconate 2-dehydrogenase gamma chain